MVHQTRVKPIALRVKGLLYQAVSKMLIVVAVILLKDPMTKLLFIDLEAFGTLEILAMPRARSKHFCRWNHSPSFNDHHRSAISQNWSGQQVSRQSLSAYNIVDGSNLRSGNIGMRI